MPIGGGASLCCLVCGASAFWRRYPKAVDRTDQLLLLAEEAADQALRDLREHHRWQGFAEVCATCGLVHWFSSEAAGRRPRAGPAEDHSL
ncbi:MAG: hypothetical protein AVDCRST_MAG76-1510 [uncultured Acidimicrobiales bacterium]|uniref:Uncharacterized protein n=1 Tax=uncultured Acidimicrobiales bacterium TaxID=310071 RepID=A0A6J4HWN0_9ACTN|nr:MAG: hypothetical protein AVDCRST_MAG76-1510 [uncultured Acidimicrobiales bacterium]